MENNKSKKNSNKNNMDQSRGTAMVVAAGICWGLMSIFVKKLNADGFESLQIMIGRTIIAALVLAVYFLIKDRGLFKIQLKDLWMFIGTGIVSLSIFSFCYYTTIINCGAAMGVVLLYTSPVFVMLLSAVFFKEKITSRKVIALLMTLLGCSLVAGLIGNSARLAAGYLLIGLGSGFFYALYSIFAGFAVKKYSSLTVTFYTVLFSGISLLCLPFLSHPREMLWKINAGNILYMLGAAIICTAVPYILYTGGLIHMEKSRAAIMVTVEPLVGTLLGIFVFKENANIYNIGGIVLIFASIVLLGLPGKKEPDKDE